jgi:glutamate-1-semialdehyde 2,1-aminomutase
VAAGIATLRLLQAPEVYERLEDMGQRLSDGMQAAAHRAGVPVQLTRIASMFCTFFTTQPVTDYTSASTADTAKFQRFFVSMLEAGVYLAPSQFEAGFVSTAHTEQDIDHTIAASQRAFEAAAQG